MSRGTGLCSPRARAGGHRVDNPPSPAGAPWAPSRHLCCAPGSLLKNQIKLFQTLWVPEDNYQNNCLLCYSTQCLYQCGAACHMRTKRLARAAPDQWVQKEILKAQVMNKAAFTTWHLLNTSQMNLQPLPEVLKDPLHSGFLSRSEESPAHARGGSLSRGQHGQSGISPQTSGLDSRFIYSKDTSIALIWILHLWGKEWRQVGAHLLWG